MLAEQIPEQSSQEVPLAWASKRYIVIGSGPVGLRFAEDLLKEKPAASIKVFGNEPVSPYNRVQLTALLAGQITLDQIDLPLPDQVRHPSFEFKVSAITEIDRKERRVLDSHGVWHSYDKLILATGARSHVPNIPGVDKQGVYVFRRLADTEALLARIVSSRRVVVLGGGLLGIEAARALSRFATQVALIQQGEYLMNRQLDEVAASLLQAEIESVGIEVITQSGVREVLGEARVDGVRTRSGQVLECDTVVVCAGIKANKELAMRSGLPVGQGVTVDDHMMTSDPAIYAIGECAEHREQLYGLVQPGFEQASVVARALCNKAATYQGSPSVTRLKVVGRAVCSMGEVAERAREPFISVWRNRRAKQDRYRKIVLRKGRLIGALAYGEWSEVARVQRAFLDNAYIWPWQRVLFWLFGRLWLGSDAHHVQSWSDSAIVCQCKQVSKGQILGVAKALEQPSLENIRRSCGASSVCGSCQPVVSELLEVAPEKEKNAFAILLMTLCALLIGGLIVALPAAQVSDSVMTQGWYEGIWNDKFWKQVTGFSLLGMTLLGLMMSLRKRFEIRWLGDFKAWRLVHLVLGVLAAGTLVLHTGLHLGSNLNQWLMINFLTLVGVGALAGISISFSHKLKPQLSQRLRKTLAWMHVLVSWPLPALLSAHIFSVYYF